MVDDTAEIETPAIDADHHFYEPLDAFSRYLPKGWAERTVQVAKIDGRTRYIVGGHVHMVVSNPTWDPIVKPGAMVDYFRGNPERKQLADCLADREPLPAYYQNRDARVRKSEEQHLENIWLLPTIGMSFEEYIQEDPEACGVAFKAYNEWILDDWGFSYQGRITTAAYLAMGDVEASVRNVKWALDQGAHIFAVRPTGVFTREGWLSPGDQYFDPIWAVLNEAKAVVAPHVAEVGSPGLDRFGTFEKNMIGNARPPLQIAVGHERSIQNYFGALVCDRLFDRFPNMRIASIENGAEFVPLLLRGLRRANFQRPGYFTEDPVETFRRHCWVAPFWEDDLQEAVDLLGADRVLFGSDWPHPEGMVAPRDFDKLVAELNDPVATRKIMHDNAAELASVQ